MYSVHQPLSRIQFYVSKTVESDLCSAIVAGTAMVGIKIHDKVVIVDTPKSGVIVALPKKNGEWDGSYPYQDVADPIRYLPLPDQRVLELFPREKLLFLLSMG